MGLRDERALFRRLINRARAKRGRDPLRLDLLVSRRAKRQAGRMADRGSIYHSDLNKLMRGVRFTLAGENVGMTGIGPKPHKAVRSLFRAFMASKSHRRNLLRRRYQRLGIGLRSLDGKLWASHVFYDPD